MRPCGPAFLDDLSGLGSTRVEISEEVAGTEDEGLGGQQPARGNMSRGGGHRCVERDERSELSLLRPLTSHTPDRRTSCSTVSAARTPEESQSVQQTKHSHYDALAARPYRQQQSVAQQARSLHRCVPHACLPSSSSFLRRTLSSLISVFASELELSTVFLLPRQAHRLTLVLPLVSRRCATTRRCTNRSR